MISPRALVLGAALALAACSGGSEISAPPDAATGCIPTTCETAGATCGDVPDTCGGTLSCGSCPDGETCGGGGAANECGVGACVPKT